ncbi:hypothetical protein KOM00_14705, partial [Geomonas sp. Red69]|uniref:hypothetical protein n=1 Tax=Geomonas diazotrophica TaxID=2843197 RepID=UPI001C12809B
MADYELNRDNKYITYPSFDAFLNGGAAADGTAIYPKVDLSLWDQATMCGTCHVGGVFYERDREMDLRLPQRLFADWQQAMLDPTGQTLPKINPITTTVWEKYDPATGAQISQPTFAPWAYPVFVGNNPANPPVYGANDAQGNPLGWVPADMDMRDPNTGAIMHLKKGQLMMPNVKEMDCLFCHLKGYDNISASVMTLAGNLAFAPGAGAGMFDMTPISPTYMGYNGMNGNLSFANMSSERGNVAMVSLSANALSRIMKQPDSNNCMLCHATKTLKNLPEMFGTTGTSNGFLSSAPMIYDPAHGMGPLGKRMVAYDLNAPFTPAGNFSQAITGYNYMSYMMPELPWPQALGATPFRDSSLGFSSNYPSLDLGGGNAGKTGPLYYYNDSTTPDQNTMKLSVMPFPRAEWFKRGDAWQDGKDVHGAFGCAGCHFTGDSTHKSQCDPGRGFDMMAGIQDGVPPLKNRNLIAGETPDKHDTRNTVKRCEFCHVTGKDYYGQSIETFGAPNPTVKHAAAGLTANIVQIVDNKELHGTFGGQGVSDYSNFTRQGKTTLDVGNHLDVMDCTVCHVQKKSMAVRTLDATSGMRFPSVIGTDLSKGMFGMFEDPAPDAVNEAARQQYNQMYEAMGYGADFIPAGTQVIGGQLQQWKPLMVWQKLGNLELPLTTNLGDGANFSNGANSSMKFRRKIYLSNPIVAAIWNNYTSSVDANGDGAPGGKLNNSKASLTGYRDIFTGELLNKNNAQGYDEPIFDPWIMRDLKEGFNFGPSALSVISVGFGAPGMPSMMAYDPSGNGKFSTDNYWKYVSIWSGAVVFTEPDQIRDYKNWRNSLTSREDKKWTGTELALVGDPFMVTHNVQGVSNYVKGKTCNECHASGQGFFNGDFTMTGSAIPAGRTYNPTTPLLTQGSAEDANTLIPVLDANGDTARDLRGENTNFAMESNMMERPLEPYRVKAYKGDLRTAFEGFNKLGQPRTTEFQQEVTIGGEEYVYTVPMQRADALYPHEKDDNGAEAKIYYKIGDIDPATGIVKTGAVAMSGREYANYLESAAVANAATYGIGIDPVADIATVASQAANGGSQIITVTKGATVDLVAADAASAGSFTYSWLLNSGA